MPENIHKINTRVIQFYKKYDVLFLLIIIYGTMRIFSSFYLRMTFAGYGPAFSYFKDLGQYSLAQAFPFLDYWTEYPPIYPWLNILAYRFSLLLPGDSTLWFGTLQRWILIPFDIGGLVLVYLLACEFKTKEEVVLRSTFLYLTAFVVLYIPLGWFDALPLFWLLLTIYLALKMLPSGSGLAAGIGFLTKPIPFLALPMAWQRFSGIQPRLKLTIATLVGVFVPMIPFIIASPEMSLAYVRNLLSRSSWETIWALLDGYHSYGKVAPLSQRFDPASAIWTSHSGNAGYEPWVTIGFAILFLFLWTRSIDWQNNFRAVAFVGLTWGLFSLWSKGYSPQWAINFVPFVALLMPSVRGSFYLLLITLGLVSEWPIGFTLAANQSWYFDAVIIWRTLLAILLTFEFGTLVFSRTSFTHTLRKIFAIFGILLFVVMLGIGSRALSLYVDSQLAFEPLRSTIGFLKTEAPSDSLIICREAKTCEHLSPYLRQSDFFWLPDGDGWQADRLPEFIDERPLLWYVEPFNKETGHDLSVERWLSEQYGKVSLEWIDGARVSRFVNLDLPDPVSTAVRFGDKLQLTEYASVISDDYIELMLIWENLSEIDANYRLFVHILDENGQIITQNDRYPVGDFLPPNEWAANSTITDRHGLILPANHPHNSYKVQIGWYNPSTGQRLPVVIDGDSSELDYFEFELTR